MLICLAMIAGIGTFHGGQAPVSIDTGATSLRRLLSTVSASSQVELRCDAALAEVTVVASIERVPLQEFQDQLAKVVGGRWRRDGDRRILYQDSEDRSRESKFSRESRVGAARALIASLRSDEPPLTSQQARLLAKNLAVLNGQVTADPGNVGLRNAHEAAFARTPLNRGLKRLVRTIRPEDLADAGTRTVFAVHPTKLQKPLGNEAKALIVEMRRDQSLWVRALDEVDPAQKVLPLGTSMRRGRQGVPDHLEPRVVAVQIRPGEFGFQLVMVEAGSTEAAEPAAQIVATVPAPEPGEDANHHIPPYPGSSNLVSLSALSFDYAQAYRDVFDRKPVRLSAPLRRALLEPTDHDPLGYLVSDCLLSVGRTRKLPMLAWATDQEFWSFAVAARRRLTCRDVEEILESKPVGMRLAIEEGWLIGRPSDPERSKALQTQRRALQNFAEAVESKGRVTVRDYGRFAAIVAERNSNLGFLPIQFLGASPPNGPILADWEAVRLLGSLSDDQFRALAAGRAILYSEASPPIKNLMLEMALSREIEAGVDSTDPSRPRRIRLEPTVVLAQRVPEDLALTLSVASVEATIAYIQRGAQSVPFRVVSVADIAAYESPEVIARTGSPFASGYAMGRAQQFAVRLNYTQFAHQEARLVDFEPARGAMPTHWSDLPASVAAAVRAAIARRQPPPRSR